MCVFWAQKSFVFIGYPTVAHISYPTHSNVQIGTKVPELLISVHEFKYFFYNQSMNYAPSLATCIIFAQACVYYTSDVFIILDRAHYCRNLLFVEKMNKQYNTFTNHL